MAKAAARPYAIFFHRIAVTILLAAPWVADAESTLQRWAGAPAAPPLELKTIGGERLALSDFRGKVVVVNFWATWCEPCVEEMPSLQRLRDQLGDERFEILAVNFQEGEPRIRGFLAKVPLAFPVLRDPDGAVARHWRVRLFPSSFVVDRDGVIRYSLVGAVDWAHPDVEGTLRRLLPSREATTTR